MDNVKRLGIGQATQPLERLDDPRDWPLDPSETTLRLTRRERLLGALTQHSKRRRPGAFPVPAYLQEWFTAPLYAKVIMLLPVLAVGIVVGWVLWIGWDAFLWKLTMAGIAMLVMAAVAASWAWLGMRGQ